MKKGSLEAPFLFFECLGAEGGTRPPTPLRVHGPEPCASANSATSARVKIQLEGWTGSTSSFAKGSVGVKLRKTMSHTVGVRFQWINETSRKDVLPVNLYHRNDVKYNLPIR